MVVNSYMMVQTCSESASCPQLIEENDSASAYFPLENSASSGGSRATVRRSDTLLSHSALSFSISAEGAGFIAISP